MAPLFLVYHALLLILIGINSQLCFCKNSSTKLSCKNEDREALLKIKLSFSDDSFNLLESWEPKGDCCKWKGVGCDAASGHIIKLELLPHTTVDEFAFSGERRAYAYLPDTYSEPSLSADELSPHLLELKHLNHLDLSGIDFDGSSIPEFIGGMKQLRYLNLSNTDFYGKIPRVLGNLTNLEVLDLSGYSYVLTGLYVDDITWISSMVALRYLDLSNVNLEKTHGVLQVLATLPWLSHLALSECALETSSLSSSSHGDRFFNSTFLFAKLEYLDLSRNLFGGEFPSWLQTVTAALKYLDLSVNGFNSSIPIWFDSFESLVHLDLSGNDFTKIEGGLSHFIRGKCNLKYLNLESINQIDIYMNYSSSTTTSSGFFCGGASSKLETLFVRDNRFNGNLFDFLGYFKNLRTLVLIGNSLSGPIPNQILATFTGLRYLVLQKNQLEGTLDANTLGKLTNLVVLDLSGNKLEGEIPQLLLSKMLHLRYLDISNNKLQGAISEVHFANLSRLLYLDISSNKLSVDLKPSWVPPFQLSEIRMGSCNFEAQFPRWIQTQTDAMMLDLSNANISGDIPEMLGTNTKWGSLNLSHNNIGGRILTLSPSIGILDLSYNLITGIMIENVSNSKLNLLDISYNELSGAIPLDFKDENLLGLKFLFLNDNNLNGTIPTSLCNLKILDVLDLSMNHLSGTIPNCWEHSENKFIDFSSNKLSGHIPVSLKNLTSLESLHLNNNSLRGEIPYSLGSLQYLRVLDLGENILSGNVPAWIEQNLTFLRALKLRGNHFTGELPVEICSLSRLRILDVGRNDLGGHIPHCLGEMKGMAQSVSEPRKEISNFDRMVMVTKGLELHYTRTLDLVVALDISSNKFVGSIPENITLLVELKSLNLSHNFLSGNIPRKIGDLKKLESLDLSNNNLSGSVPSSFSTMASLSHFNLSNNNLQGRVPKSTQLDTLDGSKHSIYAGNPLLCGEQFSKKCPGDREEQVPSPREEQEKDHNDDVSEKMMFYIGVMLGIVTGFWGVIVTLVLNRTWRVAYFNFVEDVMGSVYVAVKVKMNKIKRRRTGDA